LRKVYFSRLGIISNEFSAYYYLNRPKIYSLSERHFLRIIDSLKSPFEGELTKYKVLYQTTDAKFITDEGRDIEYFFDRIILDYPYFHDNYTGKKVTLSTAVQKKLDRHLGDFNNPALLASRDVRGYIEGFLRHKSSVEVKKAGYKKSDNKRLDAYINLIPKYFSNQECKDFWQYYYINAHLEDWGGKNLEAIVGNFLSTCKNENYKKLIDSIYAESVNARKDHLIKTYKTVDGYNLDIHLFLPDSTHTTAKSPVMVYFSGGSWTKGNPEWAFYSCADYAKRGWVAVSVEYRLADRHETTPFEAVKDARSAIRWLRMNASVYNIDTNRIVASGNSAGGHLVLTTALATDWNEVTDNLNYSASPNLLLINSGVYNLYSEDATDWITRDLKDKSLVKRISPFHLLKSGLPPMIIIHGTNDQSVDYATAKAFAEEMQKFGNDFEFHTLEGAPHYIWFDRRYSGTVTSLRKEFLKKHGYE
jgi:acetyl esterase/lipase